MQKKNKMKVIRRILLLIMIICLMPILWSWYLSIRHEKQQEELKYLLEKSEKSEKSANIKSEVNNILERFQSLYQENADLAGWLTIEGTNIDAPVMQCKDDEYYLHHNFYRKKDKYGCLYVRKAADLNTPSTNFIIYGHNMRDGSMFGSLDEYQSKKFCQEHAEIKFDTLYEERTYKVLAVFSSSIDESEEFKYYQFYQADTEEEFQYFYENVKEKSFYDTGVTAVFGDTFLTLSTCYGNSEQERFVVVAKRLINN